MRITTIVLLTALASAAPTAPAPRHLPIHHDDYANARAEATRRGLPLYIEVWAPW